MKLPLRIRTKIALQSIGYVLKNRRYIALAIVSMFFVAGLIIWSLNLELLKYILFEAQIGVLDKLSFFSYGYQSVFTTFNDAQSLGIIIFSLLFGLNTSMLVYVLRRKGFRAIPKKSGSAAFIFAILSGGCLACGTSLITPLLVTLGATSAPFVRDLSTIFNWLGSILIIYSIYKLSELIANIKASETEKVHEKIHST